MAVWPRNWILVIATVCALAAPGIAFCQTFRITSVQHRDGRVLLEHESDTAFYHILSRLNLASGAQTIVDLEPGSPKSGRLEDRNPPSGPGYYRVTRVCNDDPLDSDGDEMDDLYEMHLAALDPLDPKDAGRISPETGRTQLEDYFRDESNTVLFPFLVGRGIHDVTGPAADGGMMGYAEGDQKSAGIHDRQWARAFIASGRGDGAGRVAFVVVDAGQIFHSVTQGVHERLQADEELGRHYSFANIVMSATHTHGGAGGHSHHVLYNATIGGFAWQTYDALVHGIFMAIKKAHRNLAPGRILLSKGQLDNANENRQAVGFLQNLENRHPALKNPFGKDNRDTEMLCLRFEHSNRREIGMFNWFPVHGVSFSKENRLLTGDNKGLAAYLFEREKGTHYPGHGRVGESSGFVAGFANSNPGDLTANRRTLEPGGWPKNGGDDEARASMIGGRQYEKARALYEAPVGIRKRLFGPVDYRHMYVAMTSVVVNPPKLYPYDVPGVGFPETQVNPPWSTYIGALGIDFAKGTLDGEGLSQDDVDEFRKLNGIIPDLVTEEFERRHAPKEVVLTTGTPAIEGLTWTPQILPISILRIGNLAILAVPSEFTSMAGSRLRRTVESILPPCTHTIIAGLANDYSGYVTTFEEYIHETVSENGVPNQSYESASTQFGGFTLAAYQTKFAELAKSLVDGGQIFSERMPRTRGPESLLLKASDPILDLPPLSQTRPADFKEKAGCLEGQFWDLLTGSCWSCPAGYSRTLFSVEGDSACEIPARLEFTTATRHGKAGCGPGQFFDLLTGSCWSCPAGYNRTIFSVEGSTACEKPARSEFIAALSTRGSGIIGTDCPGGYVFDFALGRCYRCPSGSSKFILRAWNDAGACERVIAAEFSGASRHNELCPTGQFWDTGTGFCWSCPLGNNRTIFSVEGGSACDRLVPAVLGGAAKYGKYACADRGADWFLDIGRNECWSCNGWIRNLNLVDHPEACTGPEASFGNMILDRHWLRPQDERRYRTGQRVSVSFWGGHPKNVFGTVGNRRLDALSTFLEVQRWVGTGWQTIRTDADWDTTFGWERVGIATSRLTITWDVGPDAAAGIHRILHRGFSLDISGSINTYQGESPTFQVVD